MTRYSNSTLNCNHRRIENYPANRFELVCGLPKGHDGPHRMVIPNPLGLRGEREIQHEWTNDGL